MTEDRYGAPQGGRGGRRDEHRAPGRDPRYDDRYAQDRDDRFVPGRDDRRAPGRDRYAPPGHDERYDQPVAGRFADGPGGPYDDGFDDHDGFFEGSGGGRDERRGRKSQKRRKRRGRAAFLFALLFLLAVIGGAGFFGVQKLDSFMSPPDYAGDGTGSVNVQIKPGDAVETMGVRLEEAGVVKSSEAFYKLALKTPAVQRIQPGFYKMRLKMSSQAAMQLLLDPRSKAGNLLTIPEGLRASQVVEQLAAKTKISKAAYRKALRDTDRLGLPAYANGKVEGYLWPGQYDIDPKASAAQILKEMVTRFKQNAERIDLEGQAKEAGMRPGTAVIMASLIQSESGRPSDMPKISRVIYNRLRHRPEPMFLKFDSTTLYGLNKYGIVASYEDIKSKSPYNTYNYPGLPPGAISNPGEEAIKAVFEPEEGDWLFFVATDPKNKITEYATTEAEFAVLKAKLDKYLRENGN